MASLSSCCQGHFNCGGILSFNRAGWSLSMVAFGDRKDFLQCLRLGAFPAEMPPGANTAKRYRQRLCLCLHGTIAPAVFKVIFSQPATGTAFAADLAVDCLREG